MIGWLLPRIAVRDRTRQFFVVAGAVSEDRFSSKTSERAGRGNLLPDLSATVGKAVNVTVRFTRSTMTSE